MIIPKNLKFASPEVYIEAQKATNNIFNQIVELILKEDNK